MTSYLDLAKYRTYTYQKKKDVKYIKVLLPIVFFPLLLFVLLGYPLMLSWIGNDYEESVLLAKVLVCGNLLAFISYPSTQYIIATN